MQHRRRVYRTVSPLLAAALAGGCGAATHGDRASEGLVLVRSVGGSNELVRVRLSDAAERAITATPDREETWPYWSSRAGRLVFQVSGGGRESDLVLWSEQTGETLVGPTRRREERWPAWAPDGARLAYAFVGRSPPAGVALADLATGRQRVLAGSERDEFFLRPGWAPDGRRLVVQRRREGGRGSDLWIVGTEAPPRPLTAEPGFFDQKPGFTRDGTQVVFSRRPEGGGPRDVAIVAADGGPVRILLGDPGADEHSAQASPARDEIAFVSDRGGAPQVYLAALDGSGARRLGDPGESAFAPRWSPDGERIAVTLTDDESLANGDRRALAAARVAVYDRSGKKLLDAPGFMPDWMAPWP